MWDEPFFAMHPNVEVMRTTRFAAIISGAGKLGPSCTCAEILAGSTLIFQSLREWDEEIYMTACKLDSLGRPTLVPADPRGFLFVCNEIRRE